MNYTNKTQKNLTFLKIKNIQTEKIYILKKYSCHRRKFGKIAFETTKLYLN